MRVERDQQPGACRDWYCHTHWVHLTEGARGVLWSGRDTPLVTLNDPVYIEAAQALGRKAVAEGGTSSADRAAYAFRLVLSRPPTAEEQSRLVKLFETSLAKFEKQPDAAKRLATLPKE